MSGTGSSKRLTIVGILIMCICLAACGRNKPENPYGSIVSDLGDADAYAFLVMNTDYNVMAASDSIYDAGSEKQAAIFCDVYYCFSGEAKKVGSIESEGTAYPITFSKSGIYAASGHKVERYVISDKDGLLHLDIGIYESFDESGNTFYKSVKNGNETSSTEEAYQELMNEYLKSQIIHFSYGADGCVNEIRENVE